MSLLRNGSLLANALLVLTGAAAGTGLTVLVMPTVREHEGDPAFERGKSSIKTGPSIRSQALNSPVGGPAPTGEPSALDATSLPALLKIGDRQERASALRDAGAKAAARDVKSALEQASQLTSTQDKLDYLRGVYATWAKSDPRAALSYAMSNFQPGTLRNETVGLAVNRWGAADPRAAWQWSEQNLSGPIKEQAMTDLMIGWTRKTPEAAAQWLASTKVYSQPLITATASTWAERDPQAAFKWAKSLNDPLVRRSALPSVVSEWGQQDAPTVAAAIAPQLNEPEGVDLATALTNIWASTDPKAAADWVYKLPPGPGRNEAAATLATVWAASDVQGATAWAKTISDAETRRQVITHIGTTWGAIEPEDALNWLATLPANETSSAIIGAYNSWAAVDSVGLNEYVQSKPVSATMDQPRLSLADVMAATDIQASMDLALGVSTAQGRDEAVGRYFRQRRKLDDDSAQQWLTQTWTSLDATTQQRLAREQARTVVAR